MILKVVKKVLQFDFATLLILVKLQVFLKKFCYDVPELYEDFRICS